MGFIGPQPAVDVYVNSYPDAAYNNDDLVVGRWDYHGPPDEQFINTCLSFDCSSIPEGASIVYAHLNLFQYNFSPAGLSSVRVNVYTHSLPGSITNSMSYAASTNYNGSYTDSFTNYDSNVQRVLNVNVIDNSVIGFTLAMAETDSVNWTYVYFRSSNYADNSKRPYLEVMYIEGARRRVLILSPI